MSSLTSERDTRELLVGSPHYTYEREAAAAVYAGGIVAQNASGKAVPASDAADLVVLGRAETTVGSGDTLPIRTGVYLYDNGTSGEALTVADIGSPCFVVDDHTVGKVGGTYHVPVGVVVDVTSDGVAVDMTCAARKSAVDSDTTYSAATAGALGLVKQAAAVADCTAAGGSAVSVETQLNALLASLRTAGVLAAAE